MEWFCKTFQELTVTEFYQILKLRVDVFIIEQNCIYKELDDKDQKALHLFAVTEDKHQLVAYSRIFKPGDYYTEASFGRVVVHPEFRDQKIGYLLMEKTMSFIEEEFDSPSIKISAQTYLKKFYESFGFQQLNDEYLDEGIPHIDMLKRQFL